MNSKFSYTTAFMLDKAHFSECFDQSVVVDHSIRAYYKALILLVLGLILLFVVGTNNYAAFFVVALSALEALSTYYRKTWWLWRQMLSRASNSKITLIIDDRGVTTQSFHVNNLLAWQSVTAIKKTELGILIHHQKGVNYISDSCLAAEAIDFVLAQQPEK